MTQVSPWFWFPARRPDAPLRLVCVPYAGGGAGAFRAWPASLPGVEVAVVRLPGRETRFKETPLRDFDKVLHVLAAELAALRDRPLALFGHSLGGLLAFELARRTSPVQLFVSATRAPHLFSAEPVESLSDAEFIDYLRAFRLLPAASSQTDLLRLMLPAIRADFAVAASYVHRPGPPLACPLHAFYGEADPSVARAAMEPWQEWTTGRFTLEPVPGGHFFLHAEERRMLAGIDARLREHTY
ncbi:thioesterase II family protein [Nonomuraea sp. NPDC001831]|uniref:thioesterase II family protein n=1 Tax=Nonomuraea sp. NPDC001831 TaxID=3364340 RepID=UPI0036D0C57B